MNKIRGSLGGCGLLWLAWGSFLWAEPTWRLSSPNSGANSPSAAMMVVPFGQLQVIELWETSSEAGALPRPPMDDRMGNLLVRSMERSSDGRGWRLTVQALAPGNQVLPPLDFGDGRRSPALQISVPRTAPYGGPWKGFGGGHEDDLPQLPFPWAWALILVSPFLLLFLWLLVLVGRRRPKWAYQRRLQHFFQHWPPRPERTHLDTHHNLGRDLLEMQFGPEARSWGATDFKARKLSPWDRWIRLLDEGRFEKPEGRADWPSTTEMEMALRPKRRKK